MRRDVVDVRLACSRRARELASLACVVGLVPSAEERNVSSVSSVSKDMSLVCLVSQKCPESLVSLMSPANR